MFLRPLKNNIPNEKLNLEVKVQNSNLQNDDENIQIKDGINNNDMSVSVGDMRIHVYKPEEHVNGNSSTYLIFGTMSVTSFIYIFCEKYTLYR
jgi:hypothetical protein